MFFTVQKSADNKSTMKTKLVIKLLVNNPQKMYTAIAVPRKNMWKKVTYGWLKESDFGLLIMSLADKSSSINKIS